MKTTMTYFVALLIAALSASALAMPCGQSHQRDQPIPGAIQSMRLHTALT